MLRCTVCMGLYTQSVFECCASITQGTFLAFRIVLHKYASRFFWASYSDYENHLRAVQKLRGCQMFLE